MYEWIGVGTFDDLSAPVIGLWDSRRMQKIVF